MPSLDEREQNPADAQWLTEPRPKLEMTGARVSRGGPDPLGTAASPQAVLLAATALGLAVAGTPNPINVLERLTDSGPVELDEARIYVSRLQVTDDASRRAAARLLEAAAEQLRTSPARPTQGRRLPRPFRIGKFPATAESVP
jgi:hypothetical protein